MLNILVLKLEENIFCHVLKKKLQKKTGINHIHWHALSCNKIFDPPGNENVFPLADRQYFMILKLSPQIRFSPHKAQTDDLKKG